MTAFAVFLVVGALISYGPALNGPLFFDDIPNLMTNLLLQIDGRQFDDWRVAAVNSDAGILHRPVAMLSFAVNHVTSGEFSAFTLKATNLGIHFLVSALVYVFSLQVLRSPALPAGDVLRQQAHVVAMLATAIWLLHPLHVSTVLYAIQRMAQLSTLFVMAGLVIFCHYRLRWAQSGASAGEMAAAALWLALLMLLAMLSKENGALLPWLIAVVEVSLFRGEWRGRVNPRLASAGWAVFILPLLLIGALLLFFPEMISGRYVGRDFSLTERLMTQSRILWRYLGWLVLPDIRSMGFFHDDIVQSKSLLSPPGTLLSLFTWVVVMGSAIALRMRWPLVLFALLFYLVAHSMESSILPLEMVFEHRNYLPSVSICLLLAVGLFQLSQRFARLRLRVLAASVLVLLFALLWIRTHAWKDELALARHNVINHPTSPRANFFYANALFKRLENASSLDLGEDQVRDLAVNARLYFLRMHTLDPQAFAALVMLHQLDSVNFPGLLEENDWLAKLEDTAKTGRLRVTDYTALGALVDFSASPFGQASRPRVGRILDAILTRHPYRADLLVLKYDYLAGSPQADKSQLLAFLQNAANGNPGNREIYAYLLQYHGQEDMGDSLEVIRSWMKQDRRRRDLPVILGIFNR